MTRDPRTDPQPGDVLESGGIVREVTGVRDGRVQWAVGRIGYDAELTAWRIANRKSLVIRAY